MSSKHQKKSAVSGRSKGDGRNPVMQFLLTFAIVYLVTSMTIRWFFPDRFNTNVQERPPVTLSAPKKAPLGRNIEIKAKNTTDEAIPLSHRCPESPLIIERVVNDKLYQIEDSTSALNCTTLSELPARSDTKIDLSPWKYAAFSEEGTYKISLPTNGTEEISTTLRITKPGIFVSAFRAFVSKPLFNGLILIASVLPHHSLGWSIIILTLVVKLLLFFPSQHALHSQKKMQAIQPKIEAIKKQHKDNQQKMTEETMALWKKEKINPLQSCLPTFIQLPILLGLFYIIRDSDHVELAQHLLYPPLMHLDWTFSPMFLGIIDLKVIPFAGVTWSVSFASLKALLVGAPIPLTIALMQFVQMKMVFAMKDDAKKGGTNKKTLEEHMSTQNMMLYMLPVMIFFISGTLPIAVSLYWGASTIFSIGQQLIVNRK
jgi:YidC/Oxa1 family membrane protein insertase